MPEGNDIVEIFRFRRKLNQVHRPFAPCLSRFHPDAWAKVVPNVELLIAVGSALPLQKAKSFEAIVCESGKLVPAWVYQRPPDVLALAVPDRKAIGVVDALAHLVGQ